MNINLGYISPPESAQDRIREHGMVMKSAGFKIIGAAVLVPEPGEDYPAAYQVWWPAVTEDDADDQWVYIDPEGRPIWHEHLPGAFEMRDAS